MEKTIWKIKCRYQFWGNNGVEWTNWFNDCTTGSFNTEEEAKTILENLKESTKNTDKITKLKHEFKIEKEVK